MTDEKFVFVSDVKEKKRTARGSFNKRTHAGKGGKVKFPSDYLSRKELKAMNGEPKTYKLNSPMKWEEFKAMPEDLQIVYITKIREKYNVSDLKLADMFGVTKDKVARHFKKVGLSSGIKGKRAGFDSDGFFAWCNCVPVAAADDVAVEEPDEFPVFEEEVCPVPDVVVKQNPIVPVSGSMTFQGSAMDALNAIGQILCDTYVQITVAWCPAEERE